MAEGMLHLPEYFKEPIRVSYSGGTIEENFICFNTLMEHYEYEEHQKIKFHWMRVDTETYPKRNDLGLFETSVDNFEILPVSPETIKKYKYIGYMSEIALNFN